VWFAGVHSDVGGRFEKGAPLSDVPFKWMAEQAVAVNLLVRPDAYERASEVTEECATGDIHVMNRFWLLLGSHRRTIPAEANVHESVRWRTEIDAKYAKRIPAGVTYVDKNWVKPKPLPARARCPSPRRPSTLDAGNLRPARH
jgi:Uncharacterized alpha/beta hydrolase domain (DUF2235)